MEQAIDTGYDESLEAELIGQAQNDRTAFRALYQRWVSPVYKYLLYRLDSQADAEDLTSQTFLQAYEALPRFKPGSRFAAWIFTIARNLLTDYYRKSGREIGMDSISSLAGFDFKDESERREEVQALMQIIRRLPDEERELLRLRYTACLGFADIAAILGKRPDAVKKMLYRLQARLQTQLEVNHD
jgi:RNA polymerase sigma factor (sigma-70 family)